MIRLGIITVLLSAVLLACAPMPAVITDTRIIQPVPVSEMDEPFLYLAALESVHAGRPDLSMRFLTSLLEKDPQGWTPRLFLAELLVSHRDLPAALKHIQIVLDDPDAPEERRFEALGLRARISYFTGNKQGALDDLDSILAYRPEMVAIRMQHIELLESMGRMDDAHASIAEALQHQPNPHLYRIEAQLYIKQGELDRANEALTQARVLNHQDESLVLMQSELAVRRNRAGQAEKILHDFIKANPMALQVGNALGRLLISQQRFDEAVSIYEELAEKTNQHPEVLTALGLLHYQREDYTKAAAYFRQVLDKTPDNDGVRFYLAASLETTGQSGEAEKLYAAIDTTSKDYSSAQLRLAVLEFENNRFDQAARRLKELLTQQQDLMDAHIMLSSVRLRQKKYALLIKESEPALKLDPMATRLLFNRAIAFESLKQFDKLEASLNQLLEIEPEDAEALNFLGYSLADRNIRLDEGERFIRRALKYDAGNGYFLDSLAWVLYRQGKFKEALEIQSQAIGVIADDPVMHDHLGDMLWKTGNPEQARQAWQQAIDLNHEEPDTLRGKIRHGLGGH